MADEGRRDYFVSYTGSDTAWADWINSVLQQAGCSTFLQLYDIRPGHSFTRQMHNGLNVTDRMIAVLSPKALESDGATAEWLSLIPSDMGGVERRLIPIRVAPVPLPGLLRDRVFVDLFGVDEDTARQRLLDALPDQLERPKSPRFPGSTQSAMVFPGAANPATEPNSRRSDYLEYWATAYAPGTLEERPEELAILRDFCGETVEHSYLWWEAEAWAGKTALLASFAERHLPDDVDVVGFFIGPGRDSAVHFVPVLQQQIRELFPEVPPLEPDRPCDSFTVGRLLDGAAQASADRGRRLVMLIDALDEDRAVGQPDSIAALLPHQTHPALRVVVTSRPLPLIRTAMRPASHPLRDERMLRPLRDSRHAKAIGDDLRDEVARLLAGSPIERDVTGVIAAAGTGLSPTELAEILKERPSSVESVLQGVTGRTFLPTPSRWRPGEHPTVYDLGHRELRATVLADLERDGDLSRYRKKIRTWAKRYQDEDWSGAPEFLLDGYFRMLAHPLECAARAGSEADPKQLQRMVACADDARRRRPQLELVRSDGTAVSEITTALRLLAALSPNLTDMARLALRRDALRDRNLGVPAKLPAVWTAIGQQARAESLALGIPDAVQCASALIAVAGAAAQVGEPRTARELLRNQVPKAIAAIVRPDQRDRVRVELVRVLLTLGDRRDAQEALGAIGDLGQRSAAATDVVHALIQRSERTEAEALIASLPRPDWQADRWVELVEAARRADDRKLATRLARRAPDERTNRRLVLASALASARMAGEYEPDAPAHAKFLQEATYIVQKHIDYGWRHWAWLNLLPAVAKSGGVRPAEAVVRRLDRAHPERASALAEVLRRVPPELTPQRDSAIARLTEEATRALATMRDPGRRLRAVRSLVHALAAVGEAERAAELVGEIPDHAQRARTRVQLIEEAGPSIAANLRAAICQQGEVDVRAVSDDRARVTAAASLIRLCSDDQAMTERVADIAETAIAQLAPGQRDAAMLELTRAMIAIDDRVRADRLVDLWDNPDAENPGAVLRTLAEDYATAGEYRAAVGFAERVSPADRRADTYTALAWAAVRRNDLDQAESFASDAEAAARTMLGADRYAPQIRSELAVALVTVGEPELARRVALSTEDPTQRASALLELIKTLPVEADDADSLIDRIPAPHLRIRALAHLIEAGDRGQAKARIGAARALLPAVPEPHLQVRALACLAAAISDLTPAESTELLTQARSLARTIPARDRQPAVTELIDAVTRIRGQRPAIHLACRLGTDPTDVVALVAPLVSDKPSIQWLVERAIMRATGQLEDPAQQARALATAAAAFAARGHRRARTFARRAVAAAEAVAESKQQARALSALAWTVAATGDFAEAVRLAGAVDQQRDGRQAEVVRALADAGRHDEARELAERITNPHYRAHALATQIKGLAGAGELDAAAALVGEIPDDYRAPLLLILAQVAASLDRTADARRFTAHALVLTRWAQVLPTLARVDPPALVETTIEWLTEHGAPAGPGTEDRSIR